MSDFTLFYPSKEMLEETPDNASLLKLLREKKKISRSELSKRTQLTTYQVEGLEGKGAENLLLRILSCVKALGYKADDVLRLIEYGSGKYSLGEKGTLEKPQHETNFREGVKLLTYFQETGSFFGQLRLAPGKNLNKKQLPPSDIVFGIMYEGVLLIDLLVKQTVYKKNQFFVLPANLPIEFLNPDAYAQTSVLLFCIKFSTSVIPTVS